MSHSIDWSPVTRAEVMQAMEDYRRLGAKEFYAKSGFGPTTTYDLVWEELRYPPKAILGAAYEVATGTRLAPADFEGGKAGAVKILTKLGFTVEQRRNQ
jgi:hypothetical protein